MKIASVELQGPGEDHRLHRTRDALQIGIAHHARVPLGGAGFAGGQETPHGHVSVVLQSCAVRLCKIHHADGKAREYVHIVVQGVAGEIQSRGLPLLLEQKLVGHLRRRQDGRMARHRYFPIV